MWKELNINEWSIADTLQLIGDMLLDGYELKVEDHKIWYRELVLC